MSSEIFHDHFNRIKIFPLCFGLWHITRKKNSKLYKVNITSMIYSLLIILFFVWTTWVQKKRMSHLPSHDLVVKYMIGYISYSTSVCNIILILGLMCNSTKLAKIFSKVDFNILEKSDAKNLLKKFAVRVCASFGFLMTATLNDYLLYRIGMSSKMNPNIMFVWILTPAYNYTFFILFSEYLSVISKLLAKVNEGVEGLIQKCKNPEKEILLVSIQLFKLIRAHWPLNEL